MERKLIWRIVLILAVVAVAVWSLYPPTETINLGLDLSGGVHLVLEVQTQDAIKAELDDASQRLTSLAGEKGITLPQVEVEPEALRFRAQVPGSFDRDALREVTASYLPEYDVSPGAAEWTFAFKPNVERTIRDLAVRQTLETIRNRVDQFGVAEPVIQRQGLESDRLLIQLPGVDDPVRVKGIISATAFLEWKQVVDGPAPDRQSLLAARGGLVPPDAEVVPGDLRGQDDRVIGRQYYLLRKSAIVTGRDLRNARRDQGQYGDAIVRFMLTPTAGDKFSEFTGSHVGEQAAIVLDGNVISAPVIRSKIGDEGYIEGSFTIESAEDLALKLRAGALPASIDYLEERTVGPSLGRDSVERGVKSAVSGLLIVMVFMMLYYRLSGLNANLALILNIIILLGAMAYFGATLTLPGIAGVILTIGMAVDANVLIFERIREELRVGKTARSAVDTGFSRAFGTILDANITTLIAALFLFQFGTGPVKGFAVTLSIGILASVFTAVFVSRTLYMLVLAGKERVESLSVGTSIIHDTSIPFLSFRRIALAASALVIVGGLLYQGYGPGLNLGIDFVGGTQVTAKFRETPDLDRLRGLFGRLETGTPLIQRFDEQEKNEILIRVENPGGEKGDFSKPIIELLQSEFNAELGDRYDLNTQGSKELLDRLVAADPDGLGADEEARILHYEPMAEQVLFHRKQHGIFRSMDELATIDGLSDAVRAEIEAGSAVGAFSLLGAESVGPAVGADLRKKATMAIGFSLVGMLVYIWVRFQLPYGLGAVAALFHDVLITLSALAVSHRELNLPTIAALLTLVGYSVNDTVVVFDRVRENLRLHRGEKLEALMNSSINQVLSRTIITSGTTLIVVLTLYFFGGDVINTFAFVLLIGILVGTYSSIFVAAPVALAVSRLLQSRRDRRRGRKRR